MNVEDSPIKMLSQLLGLETDQTDPPPIIYFFLRSLKTVSIVSPFKCPSKCPGQVPRGNQSLLTL